MKRYLFISLLLLIPAFYFYARPLRIVKDDIEVIQQNKLLLGKHAIKYQFPSYLSNNGVDKPKVTKLFSDPSRLADYVLACLGKPPNDHIWSFEYYSPSEGEFLFRLSEKNLKTSEINRCSYEQNRQVGEMLAAYVALIYMGIDEQLFSHDVLRKKNDRQSELLRLMTFLKADGMDWFNPPFFEVQSHKYHAHAQIKTPQSEPSYYIYMGVNPCYSQDKDNLTDVDIFTGKQYNQISIFKYHWITKEEYFLHYNFTSYDYIRFDQEKNSTPLKSELIVIEKNIADSECMDLGEPAEHF